MRKQFRRLFGLSKKGEHSLEDPEVREDLERMKRESFMMSKADRSEQMEAFGGSTRNTTVSGHRPERRSSAHTPNPFVTRL